MLINLIKFRNAYILTYMLRSSRGKEGGTDFVARAPDALVQQVAADDDVFEISIKDRETKVAVAQVEFEAKRDTILDVCSSWDVTPDMVGLSLCRA